MTKERLEELIEQKGTVYDTDGLEIELYSKDKCHIVSKFDGKNDYLLIRYANVFKYIPISHLIDKEHYEWRQKTIAERTDKFEPPMWEDIDGKYRFKFMWKDLIICFVVLKFVNMIKIKDDDDEYRETYFDELATKENYEKACEIVRDLFKGESNG